MTDFSHMILDGMIDKEDDDNDDDDDVDDDSF